jgi:hypothetical protein
MGRQTRQSRRSAERRQSTRQARAHERKTQPWQIAAGVIAVLAVAAVLAVLAFKGGTSTASGNVVTPGQGTVQKVDGLIGCDTTAPGYHVHAHVTVLVDGKPQLFDRYSGLNYNHDCLYWLHVHDQSGIVHIESPNKILPTLGTWYDVMGQPLSSTQVAGAKVKPGQQLRMWVNGKRYTGDPRKIVLVKHTQVWLEIGPPFKKPTPYNFNGL